jgi:hypothetical protein
MRTARLVAVRLLTASFALGLLTLVPGIQGTHSDASGTFPRIFNGNGASDTLSDNDVQLAADSNGHWVAVWTVGDESSDTDIVVARSSDDGDSWSTPVYLNPWGETDSGLDQQPALATDQNGTWIVVWSTENPVQGGADTSDLDLVYTRSTNNGASWSTPFYLNSDAPNPNGPNSHPVIEFGDGAWVVVWPRAYSVVSGRQVMSYTRSTNGSTWTPAAFLWPGTASTQGPDNTPTLATDSNGNWMTVWNSGGVESNMYLSRSTDNGVSWTAPLVTEPLPTAGSQWNGVSSLATDGNGNWLLGFAHENGMPFYDTVWTSRSTDLGATWTPGLQHGSAFSFDIDVRYSDGLWVAGWFDQLNIDAPALSKSIDGLSWTPDAKIRVDAGCCEVVGPTIGGSPSGTWLAVWESNHPEDGAIGSDGDLVYSVCVLEVDSDCDALLDSNDNCPYLYDYAQLDTDADGTGDRCDNCEFWYNPGGVLPPWSVNPNDSDCDFYTDSFPLANRAPESVIGTDHTKHCASTSAFNDEPYPDAWPVDFNDNQLVNVSDVLSFNVAFGKGPTDPDVILLGQSTPVERFDLNGNGVVNVSDVLQLNQFFGQRCTP